MRRKMPWPRILWIVIVLVVPGIILHSFYPKVFQCPTCYLYLSSGDGLKNYYTLVYYVQHDQGWHFTGMNYPYGEHIIYTDNQPLLAMMLRLVDRHVMDIDGHVVGTLNMLLLISIYLAVILTYLLLRRWHIGKWWALGSALCIIFLSPQLLRLHGHYGLAYVFFFPLLLLLMDLLVRHPRRRWWLSLLSVCLIIAMSLTHMYFLFLSTLVVASFILFYWWYHRKEKRYIRPLVLWLTGVAILPGLFLVGLRSATDPVRDRPTEPWGIDFFTVSFESTFFPFIPPLDQSWRDILNTKNPDLEYYVYTGMPGLLLLPAVIFFLFRKRDAEPFTLHIKAFLGAGIVCWLMAAGVFYQYGFTFLWEAVPLLKQFRGLGRFGIPFYYLYMLVCSYLVWQMYKKMSLNGLHWPAIYLMGAVFLVWSFEAWLHSRAVSKFILQENKPLASSKEDYLPILTAAGYTPADFQAILQLPLVAVGCEMMGVSRGMWTLTEGIHASMETGLPLIDFMMSRTSVSHGMDLVELISSPFTEKKRARLFNDKHILLLYDEGNVIPAERIWIEQAEMLGSFERITLYKLSPTVFRNIRLPELPAPDVATPCTGWFDGFDAHPNDLAMIGPGALNITSITEPVWSFVDTTQAERHWIVSFWTRIDHNKLSVPVPRMKETNAEGTVLQFAGLHRDNIAWSEAYGSWLEVNFPLTTKGNGNTYELFMELPGPLIDNLLIRPVKDTCIMRFPEMILYNNLPIPISQ